MLRWPDARAVDEAARRWADRVRREQPGVCAVGYFGSYARGDWGVGSDLDLLVIVEDSAVPFLRRAAAWDATDLPVPADVLVYTLGEWQALRREGRYSDRLSRETIWVYGQVP